MPKDVKRKPERTRENQKRKYQGKTI